MRDTITSPQEVETTRPAPVSAVGVLLCASGVGALALQIAWMREFRLFFGASTAAGGAVLAIFMGGIGLGNAVFGKRVDGSPNPLRLYSNLEIGVAVFAVASPMILTATSWGYLQIGGQGALGIFGATVVRLMLTALAIGPATFLMGGTLPAAVRAVTSTDDNNRMSFSVIYAANTIGAVAGAGLASFVLLEHLGAHLTIYTASTAILGIGLLGRYWARGVYHNGRQLGKPKTVRDSEANADAKQQKKRTGQSAESTSSDNSERRTSSDSKTAAGIDRRLVFVIAFLFGFVFFLMELVWYRMLSPILGGSTYSFGLILIVALAGIGLGSIAFRVVFRFLPVTVSALAAMCALEAVFLALPLAMGDDLAVMSLTYRIESAATFSQLVVGWTKIAGIVVFPAAFISGMQLPILIALLGAGRTDVGRDTGVAFACNTYGAIAGSLIGGFGVLPWLSAPMTWRTSVGLLIGVTISLLIQAYLSRRDESPRRPGMASVLAAIAVVVAAGLFLQPGPTSVWRHSGIGAGRANVDVRKANELRRWKHTMRRRILWETDGVESSVAISASDGLSLMINGKSDGNSIGDAPTQIGLGVLGAILHPSPKRGLVIGLGTGESAGWLADVSPMEQVDVVELEPRVVEMAKLCADVNRNVLRNPKVNLVFNDAREVLLSTKQKYDIIVSEPSNPYRAGVATLYTREFYAAAADRLSNDGLFLQWLQAYEVDELTVAIVVKTLRTAFERVEIWQTKTYDLLLVCSNRTEPYDADHLRERIREPVIAEALLKGWKVRDLAGLFARFLGDARLTKSISPAESVPVNTDQKTILEYRFAHTVGRTTQFQVHLLRQLAVRDGVHRPPIRQAMFDWTKVEDRRLAMDAITSGNVEIGPHLSGRQNHKGVAYQAYARGDLTAMLSAWPDVNRPPDCPIELTLISAAMAASGRELPRAWMVSLQAISPSDACAVRAIAAYRKLKSTGNGQPTDADARRDLGAILINGLKQLQSDPWGISRVAGSTIQIALALSVELEDIARQVLPLMQRPFAGYRFEEKRQAAIVLVAEKVGGEVFLLALENAEPHAYWSKSFLEIRAKTYEQHNHPLAAKAREELLWFRRNAR